MGIGHIVISTDSQILKQAIVSSSHGQVWLGQLFLDIKFHLATEFIDFSVEFYPRACNNPTHVLAAMGMGMDQNNHTVFLSEYPDDVTRLVAGGIAVS